MIKIYKLLLLKFLNNRTFLEGTKRIIFISIVTKSNNRNYALVTINGQNGDIRSLNLYLETKKHKIYFSILKVS